MSATPTPTPVHPAVTVIVERKDVALGQGTTVVLAAEGVTTAGLREYDVEMGFDPTGLRVDKAAAGPAFVDAFFYQVNQKGRLLLVAYRDTQPDPTGDVELALVSFTGLKRGTWPLNITIHTMKGGDGQVIPAAGVAGAVSVESLASK